jgi:hypothetical protein
LVFGFGLISIIKLGFIYFIFGVGVGWKYKDFGVERRRMG